MAHSNLLGSDEVPLTPPGHDVDSLGPSDTSDSGSDVAGLAGHDENDPGLPVDVAAEAGLREAADIGPDDIVPRPDTDVDGDDNSPIFEDYPEVDDVEDLPDENSDSSDYGNAVFEQQKLAGRKKPTV